MKQVKERQREGSNVPQKSNTSPGAKKKGNKSSQLYLLLHTIYCKSVERVMGEKVGERLFIQEGRKASGHGHPGTGGRRCVKSCTSFCSLPAQQGRGWGSSHQSAKPSKSPGAGFTRALADRYSKGIFCLSALNQQKMSTSVALLQLPEAAQQPAGTQQRARFP